MATDNKGRYSFNSDKTLIRANQGHSIPVDVELGKKIPPEVLYHGSAEKYESSIDAMMMDKDGYEFFLSANGVWLTKNVPAKYLNKL